MVSDCIKFVSEFFFGSVMLYWFIYILCVSVCLFICFDVMLRYDFLSWGLVVSGLVGDVFFFVF